MIKKRDKLNNSALAQIESGGSSRKFTGQTTQQPSGTGSNLNTGVTSSTAGQNVNKIYNSQKHHNDGNQPNGAESGSSRS